MDQEDWAAWPVESVTIFPCVGSSVGAGVGRGRYSPRWVSGGGSAYSRPDASVEVLNEIVAMTASHKGNLFMVYSRLVLGTGGTAEQGVLSFLGNG